MTEWVFAVGRMLGLGSAVGLRPSLTLAVIGVVSELGWGPGLNSAFGWLHHWSAILVFVVLAIFESNFDKIARFDRVQSRLTMPYRLVAGGVAGAATVNLGWQGIAVGAGVGAGMAWFSQSTRALVRPRAASSDAILTLMSLYEDLLAFAGTLLALLAWPAGYVLAGIVAAMNWNAQRRRRAKYRALQRGRRPA